jgi:hypothetical protein
MSKDKKNKIIEENFNGEFETEEQFIQELTSIKNVQKRKNPFIKQKSTFINYKINEDDDPTLKILKLIINSRRITLQDLSKKLGEKNSYNLYYYYVKNKTISLPNLRKWLKVLDMKIEITFLPNEEI